MKPAEVACFANVDPPPRPVLLLFLEMANNPPGKYGQPRPELKVQNRD